jgi:hypothetical protein
MCIRDSFRTIMVYHVVHLRIACMVDDIVRTGFLANSFRFVCYSVCRFVVSGESG